jgi:hypothetical protein
MRECLGLLSVLVQENRNNEQQVEPGVLRACVYSRAVRAAH